MIGKLTRSRAGVGAVVVTGALTLGAGWGVAPALAGTGHSHATSGNGTYLNAQDRKFAMDAAQGGKFEIAGGTQAKYHSYRGDVRAFGVEMIRDHSRQSWELKAIAGKLGITLPKQPSKDQGLTLHVWSKLRGGAFDCSYIPVEVVDHQLDIAEFKDEVKDGANWQLRAFAKRWLPVLQQHLTNAEAALQNTQSCSVSK